MASKKSSKTKKTTTKARPFSEDDYDHEAPHRHFGRYQSLDDVSRSPSAERGPRRDRQAGREDAYEVRREREERRYEEQGFGSSQRKRFPREELPPPHRRWPQSRH